MVEVENDPERTRFVARKNGMEAELHYLKKSDHIWRFTRTFVPDEIRKQGVATKLVAGAFEYIRAHQIKVIPECDFVRDFLKKHPQYEELVAEE